MPGNIDEKVLSMQFDNKQFEKGIEESSKSLDEFKKKLDFSKVTSGLKTFSSGIASIGKGGFNVLKSGAEKTTSALNKLKSALSLKKATQGLTALGAVSFDNLQTSMNSLGEKLNALGSLGEMAMYRVKNAILDAAQSAIQFGKSLSVDQISQGLSKYEEKISSIKTIANATGMSADAVNTSLDRLNWFTDETSAKFTDMVNNIGKFTSVGRGLDESITAMQGIAAWGYHSGAGVAEQSRAMYNLSQALGTGTVKLMDWKSIENAGMATKEFKEQTLLAAEAAGTLQRKGGKLFTKDGKQEVTVENFNSTLAKGWFTSDVLMDVLEEYGGFATKVRAYQEAHPGMFSLASDAMKQMDIDRMKDRLKALNPNLDAIAKKTGKDAQKLKDEWQEIQTFASGKDVDYDELEKKVNGFTQELGISMDEVSRINKIVDTKERTKEIKKWAEALGIDVKTAEKLLKSLAETEETLGEKAFKSSQQAKSFTEAIDATKDAVSTQWMNSFQIIFGGLEDSIELWSDVTEMLWNIFASGGDARNNMLTQWAETFKGREDLFGEDGFIHSIYDSIMEVKNALGTSFRDVFFPSLRKAYEVSWQDEQDIINGLLTYDQLVYKQQGNLAGQELKQITTRIKEIGQSIKTFVTDKDNVANFGKILKGVFSVFQAGGRIISSVAGGIGDFMAKSGAAKKVLEVFGEISDKVSGFLRELYVGGTLNEFRSQITDTLMEFDGILDNLDLSFVTSALQAIFDVFKTGWKFVKSVIDGVSRFLKNSGVINKVLGLFNDFATRISSFTDRIGKSGVFQSISRTITTILRDVTSLLDDLDLEVVDHVLDAIFATVRGIASFIKPIISGVAKGLKRSGALKTAANIIKQISDSVKKFFDTIRKNGDLQRFQKGIEDLVAQFAGLFEGLDLSGLDSFLTGAWGIITNVWEGIKAVFTGIMEFLDAFGIPQAIVDFFGTIGGWITWFSDKMKEFHVWEDFTADIRAGIAKLKEVFDHFKEEIGRFLEDSGIAAKFREWKEKLKQWLFPDSLDENGELQGIAKIFANIRKSISDGLDKLKNAKVYDWLMEKWQWLKDSGIIQGLKDFWAAIKGIFGGGSSGEGAESAKEGEETIEAQSGFFDKLKEFISKIDLGSLTGALIGIGALVLAFMVIQKISGLIKSVTKVVKGVGEFVEGLGDITGNFAASLKKSTKWAQIGIMVAAIGAAIWLIADSVTKLGQLNTEQLIQGGVAMIVCAGVLVGVIAIMKKLSKNKAAIGIKDLIGLIVMTLMLNKLADVVIKLAQLDTDQLIRGLAGMGAILLMIFGFASLIKAEKKSQSMVDMGFLFTIGDAMLKLADVVAKLGALSTEQLIKGLAGMAGVMLMLGLFMRYTNQVINKKYYKTSNAAGFMKLIGTAVAVWLLSKVLMNLSKMSWEEIARGLVAMAGIMVLLAAFMRVTTKKLDLKNISRNTAGFFKMIGLAIVMLVMASVLKKLGAMSWEQIGKGLAAMAGAMLIVGIFMKATTTTFNKNYYSNKNQAGFFKLIGTALTMMILARVLERLAQLSWEQIGKGLTAMAGIMALLVVFIKLTTKTFSGVGEKMLTKNQAGFFKLIGIALTMAILGHVFGKLAALEWTGIAKGIVAMGAIMAMMLIFVKATSKMSVGETAKSAVTFGVMIGLGIAITLFALSIRSLASLPLSGILKGVIGLAGILLAIGLFMKATSKLTTAGGLLKGLLVLLPIALAMGAFVLALQFVKDIDPNIIAAFGVSFGIMVASMTAMMAVIAIAGAVPLGLMLKGALAISACLVILVGVATAIVAGLGALANIAPGFKKALESGVEVLGLVGKAFGALIGEFLGGILGGIASSLPKFAEGIEAIGKAIKAFSESITGIKNVSSADRDAAFSAILALVGIAWLLPRKGGLVQALIGQGDLGDFARDIGDLGKGLQSFVKSIKGMAKSVDPKDMEAAMNTATDLANFAKYVTDPGSFGDILRFGVAKMFGVNTSFEDFVSQIEPFGKALNAYSKSVKGISKISADSSNAIEIAEDILEFKNRVEDPGSVGKIMLNWFASITGQKTTFQDFIDNIEPFGNALKAYAGAIGGFSKKLSDGDAKAALDAAEGIRDFADKFKDKTFDAVILGAIQNMFGGGDEITKFERFIKQIQPFGDAMKAYAQTIAGFGTTLEEGDADAAIAAADGIRQFATKFGAESLGEVILDSIANMFGGGDEITKFGRFTKQIGPFGEAMKTYADAIGGFSTTLNPGDAEAAIKAAEGLYGFADHFKDKTFGEAILDSIQNLFGGGDYLADFTQFTAQMPMFGAGLKAYADGIGSIAAVSDADRKSAMVAAEGLREFATSFGTTSSEDGKGLFATIIDGVASLFDGGKTPMDEFKKFSESMVPFGQGLSKYAEGIKDIATLQPGQADSAIEVVNAIKAFAESLYTDAHSGDTWFDNLLAFNNSVFGTENTSKFGELGTFGEAMKALGEGIGSFAQSAGTVDAGNSAKAIEAINSVAELAKSDLLSDVTNDTGGLWSKLDNFFNGSKIDMLNTFAGKMKTFGEAVSGFATAIEDYPTEELPFDRVTKAVRDYIKAMEKLTEDDTIVELVGKNSWLIDFFEGKVLGSDPNQRRWEAMQDFINRMGDMGEKFSSFTSVIDSYKEPKEENFKNFKEALVKFAEVAAAAGEAGYSYTNAYLIQFLAEDMVAAAEDLNEFSNAINGFNKEGKKLDTAGFKAITQDKLLTMTSIMDNFMGLVSRLTAITTQNGDFLKAEDFYNLTDFGNGMVQIAAGFEAIGNALDKVQFVFPDASEESVLDKRFINLVYFLERLSDVSRTMSTIQNPANNSSISSLGDLGYQVKVCFDYLAQVPWDSINQEILHDASTGISILSYALSRLHEAGVNAEDISTMQQILELLFGVTDTAYDQTQNEAVAKKFVGDFCTYLGQQVTTATSEGGGVYVNGYNMTIGFVNGMLNPTALGEVASAAQIVVNKAIATMKLTADEASPSKITTQIGSFMSEGLAIGLGQKDSDIKDGAQSAVSVALAAFNAALSEDPEEQPMITPVVDLSNVEAGADAAGAMFGGKYTLGVNTSGDLAGRAANKGGESDSTDVNVNVDTTSIAATIDTMNTKLTTLANQMANLRVVMNSGALVGQIAPQMNRELGRIANRSVVS